jgi:CubicO group peptidase (beta-lactamase class C family)
LTQTDLIDGFNPQSPLDEAALTMPDGAAAPRHNFEGRLELIGESENGGIKHLRGGSQTSPHLPEFDFEFVQTDGYLVPVRRGLIITAHDQWNYFLEPGRVWYEPGDGDYSRASFPFALSWKGSNAIHNGTMTFLFNDNGISKVWYQATQEITFSYRADLWGLLEAVYHPVPVAGSDQVKADFTQELADRYPTKPIEVLAEDYPQLDPAAFGRDVSPEAMSWYGFVVGGVNYLGGCQTRYGVYPYCEYMRAPSYSTAKSVFASLALMCLAQKYGPDVRDALIKDYVPEAADSSGDWSAVTFDHVLDMATGNYKSSDNMVDEEHWDTDPFWLEDAYEPRIKAAFNWPNSDPPGRTWVYRTFDTFIVTRAMQNYLVTKEGEDADIFEFMVDEVYRPLKMAPGVFSTLRTSDDNWNGQPYGGYGLWWIPDDLAKISTFLNVDHGVINGEQVLQPGLLDAALQRDPSDRGVTRNGYGRYNNAFWADEVPSEQDPDCSFWVTHMYGISGIVVTLMPNGTAYYYASDNQEFTSIAAVRESDKFIPMCGK